MNNGFAFLVSTLFSLFIMAVVVRGWMQLVQANYFSPLALAIRKITDPVVLPLKKVLPSVGRLDLAVVVLALALTALKIFILASMAGQHAPLVALAIVSVRDLALEILQLVFWILIIRAILSWFSQGQNPLEYVLYELTEPLLRPIRNFIPPLGGLDLSVLILIIFIQFLMQVI
ncbi:hypothetical protein CWE15_09455 [Aliidiomarina taiwanensis]|uniref:YggT family protein n=1 Tax=Aliidiomarina taiwanensis TaxID=946228 RepID=A0A432X003_9GAMM|nr:YggT family protein [Aliidiomarina taiwanensis]RUO39343.1 hypothetical protein CWE15_09455 [Aliidiomarina taiwanensis]